MHGPVHGFTEEAAVENKFAGLPKNGEVTGKKIDLGRVAVEMTAIMRRSLTFNGEVREGQQTTICIEP